LFSIDGGGVRGIIPAVVLAGIETKTQQRISHLFQSGLTGTSTGGLIALGLAARKGLNSSDANYCNPLFTAEELVTFYHVESKHIFPNEETAFCCSCWVSFLDCLCCKGICSSEYDNQYLSRRLKETFGSRKLKDSLVPVQVVAFDLYRNAPVYFSTIETPDILMYDAAMATTAAPTFFPAHPFTDGAHNYLCVDGGVFENNPVTAALKQAMIFYKNKYKELVSKQFRNVRFGQFRNVRF
jgi:patatin-like phospholipase/acyl hydrolase